MQTSIVEPNRIPVVLGIDSQEYEVLYYAAQQSVGVPGASCEIGVREGGGSEIILRAQRDCTPTRPHVMIDPWGNLPYAEGTAVVHHDYVSQMRRRCAEGIMRLAKEYQWDVLLFWMRDTDFFQRFADGVPYYPDNDAQMITHYSMVHFDGPHSVECLQREIAFFGPRMSKGAFWVFDDVEMYNHAALEEQIASFGFDRDEPFPLGRRPIRKMAYRKY
jgi:hypothetical protein